MNAFFFWFWKQHHKNKNVIFNCFPSRFHSTNRHQLFTLWSWLPVRITMYQPVLLYTTEEHGCSLTTFYVRVEQHEPTLLMIKTCNNEVIIFCSFPKSWPHNTNFDFSLNQNRCSVPIVHRGGSSVTSRTTVASGRRTLAPAKRSCSLSIRSAQNIPGSESRAIRVWATHRNCSWPPTPRWSRSGEGECYTFILPSS